MTTITLPDHISFEEIAAKWCEWRSGGQLKFCKNSDGIYAAFMFYDINYKKWINIIRFFFDEKKFKIIYDEYDDIFYDDDFILDYIKERSHG